MFMNQLPIYVQLTMFHMMYNLKLHGGYNVYNQLIDMVSPWKSKIFHDITGILWLQIIVYH